MRYVPHPVADKRYFIFTPTDIGVIIRTNDKVFLARNSSNPTMEDVYDMRVYNNVWMHNT